ncbi:hypothetical protein HPG69_013928 [Diceros bicornis minor]|uniref:Transmembrane channel-like protein n=1 Tax=Diceros bicornis minor TaxID=77932 RepID=A0A7J7EN16_DICBM|nr:hypothetical protein HPG69_013928 [Diceros bicornis minor]
MEGSLTLEPEAWGSSGGWPAPREARAGPSLSSVLNELPSTATLRYRGPGVPPWGALEEDDEDGERSIQALAEAAQKELQEPHASRELPWPMQARRAHRQSHDRDQAALGSGSRVTYWALRLRRSKEKMREGLRTLLPWAWTLKRIGGQFGAGTESYFSLLRFLLLLNLLASVLKVCMALLPTWLEGAPPGPTDSGTSSPCGSYDPRPQGLIAFPTQLFNLLSGEGFLEWSYLFYGFYPPRPRLAVSYLCSFFVIGVLHMLLILRRSVSWLKQTLLAESGAMTSYSHRVFSAWDFGLCGDVHVRLRQRNILYELQVELEEAALRRHAALRTLGQQVRLWSWRMLLHLLVGALLGAAFYGIYWVTGFTAELQERPDVQQTPLLKLVVNYLPSIFISVVNFVLPPVFKLIAPLEGYSRSHQICWETKVGQEMYRLLLFDLLTGLAVALLIQFPRKLFCGFCPGALGRMMGTQEFQVPDEVLGLTYAQTVVWVGSFFCPLLPLLNTAKFLLLFYLKKFTLFSTCSPASRTFRASTVNFFFPLVLLLGLAISAASVLYGVFLIQPSKLCGPFRELSSIWAQIPKSISSLPQTTQNFLFFLGTQDFAVPLLVLSSILMAYTLALANSYGRLISELKRQIKTEAQNKVFLAQRAVALSSANGAL